VFVDELHSSLVFSPDEKYVYWSEMEGDQIRFMERLDDGWSPAQTVPFALPGGTGEPMLAPDGKTLLFLSSEPIDRNRKENVWLVRQTPKGWSDPEPLGPGVNRHPLHWSVSISAAGTLYFGHAGGDRDIYRSELRDDVYQDAEPVGQGVNTLGHETTPFIAPDETYLLFARSDEGSMADLYVSFRDTSGYWQEAVSLGDAVNTVSNHELCPYVSPDGEYLFFIRNVEGDLKPHWVRSTVFLEDR
jgi:Tol biopolymer transport system component